MNARPDRLLPLRYRADVRTLGFLAAFIALIAVQWSGECRHGLLLAAACVLAFVACVIKHNHLHCRTFVGRGWNRAFDVLLALCTGQSTTAVVSIHNERHHGRNATADDCVRAEQFSFRANWLNFAVFFFVALARVVRVRPADLRRWRAERPTLYTRARTEWIALAAFTLAAALADWRATALYLGVPWLFGNWGIVTINLLQHQDCDPASPHDHSRNLTGRGVNWLCLNNGWHTAHHERPALHWSRLPAWHRAHVAPFIRAELNEPSLPTAAWSRFILGKR